MSPPQLIPPTSPGQVIAGDVRLRRRFSRHRTWSVPDASCQPQLNTEITPYHTKLSGIKTGDILPALIPLNLLFTSFPLMSTEIIAHIFQRAFFKAADLGLADMDFFRHFGLCFAFKKTHVYDMAFPLREPLHGFIQ